MKALLSVIFVYVIGLAFADVTSRFREEKIEPVILDKAPTDFIEIKYGDLSANLGNELKPAEVVSVPEVNFNYTEGVLYTLVMLDRYIPNGPQVNHWIVVNIPDGSVSKGDTVMEYVGPQPPDNNMMDCYIFLTYVQKERLVEFAESDREVRLPFWLREFTERYHLEDPVAGNFFKAQYQSDEKK